MNPKVEQRPVDRYYEEYNQVYQRGISPVLVYLSVVFILFGMLGVAWAIPFPHIAFLGQYNMYLNWASFLVAGLIYYFLRLSPILSYIMLLVLFVLSYGIIQLEQWQKAGGPSLLAIGLVVLVTGMVLQLLMYRMAKTYFNAFLYIKAMVWTMVNLLKSVKLKY